MARIYDYLLGGKDNFESDRQAASRILEVEPESAIVARENRAFLRRAVQYLAAEAGIRQFLDIGAGLPTVSNTRDIAQAIAPESRIVYADNDPIVLRHAQALLTSSTGRPPHPATPPPQPTGDQGPGDSGHTGSRVERSGIAAGDATKERP